MRSDEQLHGGLLDADLARLGRAPGDVVDFSVNVNPYGPDAHVLRAVREAPVDRYPDPTGLRARQALGERLELPAERLVLGNGAAELLWTLVEATVRPGDAVLVVEPTFSELRSAAVRKGAHIASFRVGPEDGFRWRPDALAQAVRDARPRLVYLGAPNNPTGISVEAGTLAWLAERAPETTFVVDQSFLSLSVRHDERRARLPDNVVGVRSLTKDHAIPGVRAGYLVATRALAARVESCRPPWTVSAPAQAAVVAACERDGFVDESRARLWSDRDRLIAGLRAIGFDPLPSDTPFFLVRVGDAPALRRRLFERHAILVRDCASFGLAEYIRLMARPAPDADRLVAALRVAPTIGDAGR